jgi:hypothetical protein
VVCGHLVRALRHPTSEALGFIENSSDPDDLQAWCDACEKVFLREQSLTEAFRAFNDMARCASLATRASRSCTPRRTRTSLPRQPRWARTESSVSRRVTSLLAA